MKLKIQLAVVATAFAGARIERGVISAGYSLGIHVSQHALLVTIDGYLPSHSQPADSKE